MKPILFNTEMVRAILDGCKTVTRRVVKPQPPATSVVRKRGCSWDWTFWADSDMGHLMLPPYQPGDILWVRETWRVGAWDIRKQEIAFDYKDGTCGPLVHIADRELFERLVNQSREDARKAKCQYNGSDFIWGKGHAPTRWRPSIHMPKEAARLFLRVTGVRVERLRDIDNAGARAEGCDGRCSEPHDGENSDWQKEYDFSVERFETVWDSTIKPADLPRYGWEANPWTWVIEFERVSREAAGSGGEE